MGIGSIFVGIALGIVVVVYVARPFRSTQSVDVDRAIEVWVSRARAGHAAPAEEDVIAEPTGAATEEPVNFCSQCGRRVAAEDRFCPGCGKSLRGGI